MSESGKLVRARQVHEQQVQERQVQVQERQVQEQQVQERQVQEANEWSTRRRTSKVKQKRKMMDPKHYTNTSTNTKLTLSIKGGLG